MTRGHKLTREGAALVGGILIGPHVGIDLVDAGALFKGWWWGWRWVAHLRRYVLLRVRLLDLWLWLRLLVCLRLWRWLLFLLLDFSCRSGEIFFEHAELFSGFRCPCPQGSASLLTLYGL